MSKSRNIFLKLGAVFLCLLIVIGVIISQNAFIKGLVFYRHTVNLICLPDNSKCITTFTYRLPHIGSYHSKIYIFWGKHENIWRLFENYMEYSLDADIFVLWDSNSSCKIISNGEAIEIQKITTDANITLFHDNEMFEHYANNCNVLGNLNGAVLRGDQFKVCKIKEGD